MILLNIVSDNRGYLLKTSNCRIPEMYLNGPNIDKFMDYSSQFNCSANWEFSASLVISNLTSLTLNFTTLAILNINAEDPSFKCYYTPIKRLTMETKKSDEDFDDNKST